MHPWHRWFARVWLDYVFAGFVVGVILGLVAPDSAIATNDYAFLWIAAFCWLPLEAILVATFGATPGKYLVGMTVRRADGQLLTLPESFGRAASVWAIGCALMLPLIPIFTFNAQYNRLRKGRDSFWDEKGGYVVEHQPLSLGRTILLFAVVFGALALIIIGTQAGAAQS